MSSNKPDLTGVPETMLQTLYARAKESKKENHHIYDAKAIEIADKLDYDFSAADSDSVMSSGVIARTIVLDKLTEDFLENNKGAVVINIACGLDMRCCRMKNYSRWYNLDLPETMEIRKKFVSETETIKQIAASADDETWAKQIECSNKPVLIITEGLSMYLKEEQIKKFFSIIDENFSRVTVFFETMNPMMVKHIKEKSIEGSQAKFTWGIKNGAELSKKFPAFSFIKDVSLTEGMKEFIPVYKFLTKVSFISNISNKITVLKK